MFFNEKRPTFGSHKQSIRLDSDVPLGARRSALPRLSLDFQFTSLAGLYKFVLLLFSGLGVCLSGCDGAATQSVSEAQSWDENHEKLVQLVDSIKCIVPAPQWYKFLWLDLNSKENHLGRRFMTHYMGCSGSAYRLSEVEFRALPIQLVGPEFGSAHMRRDFIEEIMLNRRGSEGDKISDIDENILASTHFGNTLGHFQMELKGSLVWRKNVLGKLVPHFKGQAKVRDRYDFNPSEAAARDSWRGRDTELRVRIAHIGMPGKAFDIESEWLNFSFDYPRYDSDLIQESENSERSGYSEYGERVQAILITELRSSRWEKASQLERVKILLKTMRRLHESLPGRSH